MIDRPAACGCAGANTVVLVVCVDDADGAARLLEDVLGNSAPRLVEDRTALPAGGSFADLSSRQQEILRRLLEGERVPTIARTLYLSPTTVRNHLCAMFRKFGVHSQEELIERVRAPRSPR